MHAPSNLRARMGRLAAASAMCALCAGNAGAIGLQQAYEAALQNDATYRMNAAENEMGKENRLLGRAGMLPSVSASVSGSRNRTDQINHVAVGPEVASNPTYFSRNATIQLRQTLYNMDARARYRQGVAQSKQSAEQFIANTGEVALRVTGAYLDALLASDQLALVQAQRDAYREQQIVNQRLFEHGEGTRTDMLETQARLDLSEAQLIEAQDTLTAQRNALESMIGMDPGVLDRLTNFHFAPLDPSSYDDWKAIALKNNHDLESARFGVQSADAEIAKAKAGHAPRLDFVSSYSKGLSESLNTYNQDITNRSIGLQLNIPMYAGGAVNAQVRQALAGKDRASADLDIRTGKVLQELRKAHSLVTSSVAHIEALQKAVESGKLLMKATEQSIKGGVRINLDLLNAQQQFYASERDLAQARYSYLVGVLRLRAAAGVLAASDVREIAAYFR